MGFLLGSTIKYIAIEYELHVIACVLSLAVGLFLFSMASTKEIKNAVHDFNKVINDQSTSDNRTYHMQQFSTFIYAHSTVKQLSGNDDTSILTNSNLKI